MKTLIALFLTVLLSSCVLDRANVQPFTQYNYAPLVEDSLIRRITDGKPFPKRIDSLYYNNHYYSFRIYSTFNITGVYYRKQYYKNHPMECSFRVEQMHSKH